MTLNLAGVDLGDISELPALDISGRLSRLRDRLVEVDSLVVTHLPNVRYLSGFTGSAGTMVVDHDHAWLITDGRYSQQVGEQIAAGGAAITPVVLSGGQDLRDAIAAVAQGTIGFESEYLTVAGLGRLAGTDSWKPTSGLVEELRLQKDPGEVERIARACAIADAAFAEVRTLIRPGVSEREIAIELEFMMRRLGADAMSFEPIVAAGPHGALPHARPTDALIPDDTLVVCDFGCVVDGYCSDMTRTVIVGTPPPELGRAYSVVYEAQAAGVRAAHAGIDASALDAATRDPIREAGFGEYYVHGTGHGVGIEIHEAPRVGATANGTILDRTILTVEPGIYLPGLGGVRIEDTLFVTDGEPRVLTQSPKDSL